MILLFASMVLLWFRGYFDGLAVRFDGLDARFRGGCAECCAVQVFLWRLHLLIIHHANSFFEFLSAQVTGVPRALRFFTSHRFSQPAQSRAANCRADSNTFEQLALSKSVALLSAAGNESTLSATKRQSRTHALCWFLLRTHATAHAHAHLVAVEFEQDLERKAHGSLTVSVFVPLLCSSFSFSERAPECVCARTT